jgi:hypothetical protein
VNSESLSQQQNKRQKSWTELSILGRFARLKNNSCEVEIVKALSSRSVLPIFPVTFCIKNIKLIESNRNVLSKEIICTLAWFWKALQEIPPICCQFVLLFMKRLSLEFGNFCSSLRNLELFHFAS